MGRRSAGCCDSGSVLQGEARPRGARGPALRLVPHGVLRFGAARRRGTGRAAVRRRPAARPCHGSRGRHSRGRGGRRGLRRPGIRVVAGLSRTAGALLGRHREPATLVVLGGGEPRRPRPRRRADAAGGTGCRFAAPDRAVPAEEPRAGGGARGGRPDDGRRRRPVADEQGRGGARLAPLPPLAAAERRLAAGPVAALGARGPGGGCPGAAARHPHRLVNRARSTSTAQARSGSVANRASPCSGRTCAVNPSSSRALLGEATTWRTSPIRNWPVTWGWTTASEAPARTLPSATARATSAMPIGWPEQTLYAECDPSGRSTTAMVASALARATSSTCTKSRICPPSSKTTGASPRSSDDRNIAATPEYGVSRGIPAP